MDTDNKIGEVAALINQVNNIIAILEFNVTLFAVVISVSGIAVTALSILNGRRIEKVESIQSKNNEIIEEKIQQLKDQQSIIQTNLTVTAGMVVNSLPQLTFTQQIPNNVFSSVRSLNNQSYYKALEGANGKEIPDVARVLYAQAIYKIAAYPNRKKELISDDSDSAKSLLLRAFDMLDENLYSQRDIKMRLIQAYRQAGAISDAINCAEKLFQISTDVQDEVGVILSKWSTFLIKMQEALSSNIQEMRQQKLVEAFEDIEPLFDKLYGWDGRLSDNIPGNLQDGSIAYYTAKVLLAYRASFSGNPDFSRLSSIVDQEDFVHKLQRSLDVALIKYEIRRSSEIEDMNIKAIYNFCTAFILMARLTDNLLQALTIDHKIISRKTNIMMLISEENYQDYLNDCLEKAEHALSVITNRSASNDLSPLPFIYTESTELIDQLPAFKRDLELLRQAQDNPIVFWGFFGTLRKSEPTSFDNKG